MNAVSAFLQADWAERVGWTLLHSLWQIAAVAAAYAIVAFLLRNRSADSRYVLGCVAILAMLGLLVGTYVLLPHDLPAATELAPPPSTPTEPDIVSTGPSLPVRHSDPSLAEAGLAETTIAKTTTLEAPVAAEPVTTDLLSELRRFLPWITAAWLTGVLLLSLRPLWGWFHVRRLMRRGLSPLSDALRQAAQRAKQRLRMNRAVRFAQSALVEVPTVVGCLRPMVLLPASAISGLSTAQIELILAHELAHVRRHDWLVNFAQTVVEALLFYHPAMWWVSNQIRKERENCCDDMAVAISDNRTTYVQALARLEEYRSAAPASVLGATGGSLLGRVRRLTGEPTGEFGSAAAGVWFLGLACLLVGVVLTTSYVRAWGQTEDSPPEDPSAKVAELPKEPSIEKKRLPTLKVRAVDKHGKPIADALVLCFDGNNFWAGMPVDFEQITKRSDKDGLADLGPLPQDYVRVRVDAFNTSQCNIFEGDEGFEQTGPANRLVEITSDAETVTLVFTMRRHVDLNFEIIDAATGKAVRASRIYVRDNQQKRWWILSKIDAEGQYNYSTIVEEMSDAQFRVAASGYYPVEFHLEEQLELGKKAARRIEMKPAPEIRFTLLTPQGKPAEGVSFKYVDPEDLHHSLSQATNSDSTGTLAVPYPAQGDLALIELSHESGTAVVAVKSLPEPVTVTENDQSRDVIPCEVRLSTENAESAVERKSLPRLKVHVLDKDRQPVPGRSVLLSDRYHGVPINFELVSQRSDENGWADLGVLPQDNVCVQVSGGPHTLRNRQARSLSEAYAMIYRDGEGRFQHTLPENPMAKLTFDRETNALVITFAMRQGFDLQFQGLDAKTGKEVLFTGVFYKDLQRKRWWYPAMMDGSGTQHNFSPITAELSDAPFRIASNGYYPADFHLNEKLELGKQYIQRVELTPAPDIRFTVLTSEGKPAGGARFRWINPKGLSNMGLGKTTTDANGVLETDYPAQGELTSFHITHASGTATIAVKDLPKPTVITQDGERDEVITCDVHLPRDDAIQAVLFPGEFKYGKQSLAVHVTNDSSMTQFLARGDYPQEILVDGITYRMARFDIGWYAIKPRPISPRSRDHGRVFSLPKISVNGEVVKPIQLSGSVFDRPKIWVNYENRMPLQLTPSKHTVQAVFYLLDPETGRRGRRVLSNAIEIGADGRAEDIGIKRQPADFRDVKIRMLGGEARKPLAGLELTVSSGGTESYTVTTEQDGLASIRLPYGYHRVSFTSPKDLPYLPFWTDSLYPRGDSRSIRVAKTPGEQTIEMVLADPCELVLRAVDVDTGKGTPGVRFALESMYEEAWAEPIRDETIRARSKDRRAPRVAPNDQSLDTDERGYFRRYVGPRHDEWSYWVEVSPDGYRLVSPRGDVKIDTSLGKKRAEQTFLFRRRDADAAKVD